MNLLVLPVFILMGIVFHELFVGMRVMADVRGVLRVAPAATRVIRSDTLSDLEKERAVRRMSVEVLRDTARFTAKIALVLGACVAIAAAAQGLLDVSPDGLEGLLTSWWALAALLLVMPLYARFRAGARADGRADPNLRERAIPRSGEPTSTRIDGRRHERDEGPAVDPLRPRTNTAPAEPDHV